MELKETKKGVKKKQNRRRAKTRAAAFLVVFLMILGVVLGVLVRTVLFPVEEITVTGNSVYSYEQVLASSGVKIGDKLFAIREKNINAKLTVELPYISKANLKRTSFNSIEISVLETDDIFCYQVGTMYITADSNNKALNKFAVQPEDIVLIKTVDAIKANAGYIIEMPEKQLALINEIYSKISEYNIPLQSIDITNQNAITLVVKNRFSVNLGYSENLDGKLAHLNSMLPQIDAKNGAEVTGKINLSAWSTTKREGFFEQSINFQ